MIRARSILTVLAVLAFVVVLLAATQYRAIYSAAMSMVPPENTVLSISSAIDYPNVSGTSRTPTCTGLSRHPSGTGWLVGDDGRVNGVPGGTPAIIWYSDDFQTQLGHFTLASIGVPSENYSVQGVVGMPDGTFYAVGLDIDYQNTFVFQADATTGELIRTFPTMPKGNGIAYDYDRGEIIVLTSDNILLRISEETGEEIARSQVLDALKPSDMAFYLGDGKLLVTFGKNNRPGRMAVLDVSSDSVSIERTFSVTEADAIEGAALHDGLLYLNNDGVFHNGSPMKDRILTVGAQGLF